MNISKLVKQFSVRCARSAKIGAISFTLGTLIGLGSLQTTYHKIWWNTIVKDISIELNSGITKPDSFTYNSIPASPSKENMIETTKHSELIGYALTFALYAAGFNCVRRRYQHKTYIRKK